MLNRIKLNDLLHLNDTEIDNSKLGLNMKWKGKMHFDDWYESDVNNRNVDFSYHSHYAGKRNFKIGQFCFGFVRIPEDSDKWLLVTAGIIKEIPTVEGTCIYEEMPQFNSLLGRLIIALHKGQTQGRYIFNLRKYIDQIEVMEILPYEYEPIKFTGYDNVHLPFRRLEMILKGEKYSGYREALGAVKGIYCLTDTKTGKCYIGSASGKEGILQRWRDYTSTCDGSNQALIELHRSEGDQYFRDYFFYSLLEVFPHNTDPKRVLDRENYWKEIFQTKENGYNRN